MVNKEVDCLLNEYKLKTLPVNELFSKQPFVPMAMLDLEGIHHIAIICSDYERSKHFYTKILGFTIVREIYREERRSHKLDLALNNNYLIELFSFPEPPERVSQPEACGLRHLAFSVSNIDEAAKHLRQKGIITEAIRTDEFTGKRFLFFNDPDQLPIELYEK